MLLPNYEQAKKRDKKEIVTEKYEFNNNLSNIGLNKTYHIKTYGCQMNEHDTENIKAMLEQLGFKNNDNYETSDLIILNTCSIRENSHNKAFGMLGRIKYLKETRKDVLVGLCGCMAQEEKVVDKIMQKYKFVNFVFGTHNLYRFPEILNESIKNSKQEIEVFPTDTNLVEDIPIKRTSKYKAYVNIIYGCDKFCTYCIVPFTRGSQRSRDKFDILKEVEQLVKDGYKEVILLGQNVNAYGKDLNNNYTLENLLEDVAKTNIPRVSFMTSHPWDFSDNMIEVISKYENIMPSIHLPVQSGSNKVLKLMGRRYTKEDYLTLINKLRSKINNISISTDIIVGFPNETEEDFQETIDLVHTIKYNNAFTFIYSKREGTAAAKLDDIIDLKEKEDRLQRLNKIINNYLLENNKQLIKQEMKVLVEGKHQTKEGYLYGHSETSKIINFEGDISLIGEIVKVKITNAKTWSLDGKRV